MHTLKGTAGKVDKKYGQKIEAWLLKRVWKFQKYDKYQNLDELYQNQKKNTSEKIVK